MELNADFSIVGSPKALDAAGISVIPALTVDGDILLEGFVPSLPEMLELLEQRLEQSEESQNPTVHS